jgi:phosphoglycerate dehydrogenase-like enzyme
MATQAITIWCNMHFPPQATQHLIQGTASHRLLFSPNLQASNLVPGIADPQLSEAQVIFGQPDPAILLTFHHIKWVHLTSAGYDRYDRPDLRQVFAARGAVLTNSSSVYEEPCAEHALAMMLALARRLGDAVDEQRGARGWPSHELRAGSRLLSGQSTLILGHGAIARRLIELLAPFHMKISVVRRSVKGNETVPTFANSEVERLIPLADHIVNILPGGAGTANFMSAERLSLMKPSSILYNIGRGGTVDQQALAAMLQARRIAGAYLDVTTPEPLPADHPLWKLPNCYITPHTAGGADDEHVRLVQHFLDNLELFVQGQPLRDRVI